VHIRKSQPNAGMSRIPIGMSDPPRRGPLQPAGAKTSKHIEGGRDRHDAGPDTADSRGSGSEPVGLHPMYAPGDQERAQEQPADTDT
jgi:hypothetical protein